MGEGVEAQFQRRCPYRSVGFFSNSFYNYNSRKKNENTEAYGTIPYDAEPEGW
jgi:hypothetical protein